MLELGMKIFKLYTFSEAIARNRMLSTLERFMLVHVKILPSRLPETRTSVHYTGQDRGPTDDFPDPLKANFTAH